MSSNKKISIIGLGYVGLPLAYLAAYKGYNVIGVDIDLKKVNNLNEKKYVPKQLVDTNKKINVIGTDDYDLIKDCDTVIICVPTPTNYNKKPDLSILENVIYNMSFKIKKGALVIVESTIGPGMTKEYVIERFRKYNNLILDVDYKLAYCPERIDPGNEKLWVGNINRVCGATNKKTLEEVLKFYKSIVEAEILPLNSIEEAEIVKTWENSFRNISIGVSNLLAKICDEFNFSVNDIINGLNSKVNQFGMKYLNPGLGPGGHCIPEDNHYLIEAIEKNSNIDMNIFKDAAKINESMVSYAAKKLSDNINNIESKKILMLGLSYKPNSDDTRCSKALELYKLLKNKKYDIVSYDYILENRVNSFADDIKKLLNAADIVVLACPHDKYLNIDYNKFNNIKYIFDCWNRLDKQKIKSSIKYFGIGE